MLERIKKVFVQRAKEPELNPYEELTRRLNGLVSRAKLAALTEEEALKGPLPDHIKSTQAEIMLTEAQMDLAWVIALRNAKISRQQVLKIWDLREEIRRKLKSPDQSI